MREFIMVKMIVPNDDIVSMMAYLEAEIAGAAANGYDRGSLIRLRRTCQRMLRRVRPTDDGSGVETPW